MPKIKTNKSAAKRFKKTGTGKLMHEHSLHNHLMINKGKGQSRRLNGDGTASPDFASPYQAAASKRREVIINLARTGQNATP